MTSLWRLAAAPVMTVIGLDRPRTVAGPPPDPPAPTGARTRRFVHRSVVVPELPEPHRFLACAVMIGQSGVRMFDDDDALMAGPGRSVTVATGTAASACSARMALAGCGPHRYGPVVLGPDRLVVDAPDVQVDLTLTPMGSTIWFARSALYRHAGVPAVAEGTVNGAAVRATCSVEHATAPTAGLLGRPVPAVLKLPVDRFAYQVLARPGGGLVLLTDIRGAGTNLAATMHVVERSGATVSTTRGVVVEPEGAARELTAPDGTVTVLPECFRWSIGRDRVEVAPDTSSIYGMGRAWMGGARFTGSFGTGRAYYEWGRL